MEQRRRALGTQTTLVTARVINQLRRVFLTRAGVVLHPAIFHSMSLLTTSFRSVPNRSGPPSEIAIRACCRDQQQRMGRTGYYANRAEDATVAGQALAI